MARTEFDRDQFDEAYPPGIERSWWHRARANVITRVMRRHVPRSSRVLEVGCGTGIVTGHLRRAGWDVTGVELGDPRAGLLVPEHLMLGTDALRLPSAMRDGFQALAMFDVIEHVADASAFLRSLLAAFRNARYVVVTVPARQELWTTFDDHFGHFRRYDRTMLRHEFSASGLRTISAGYFFHALHPAIAINNALRGRKRSVRFRAPAPGIASAAHVALGTLFTWEQRLLPGGVPGSSIIAVAHRV